VTITLLATIEIESADQSPGAGKYWAPPAGHPGYDPAKYALHAGNGVKVAWWIPISAFSNTNKFSIIELVVGPDDVTLALLGNTFGAGGGAMNIQIFIGK
jgi:hypothetical protein